jgi:uncharacterized protein (DUF433 family)
MPAPQGRSAATDIRDQPAYSLAEGSRYLKLPTATLRAWAVGRAYPTAQGDRHFRPLIRPARKQPTQLSFWNLIEAHVLRSFRTDHGVSLKALRQALDFAERELRIERLLLRKELCADAGQLFLDRYGELINLSASGQLATRRLLEEHLRRVEWDAWKFPVRLYPFLSADLPSEERPIAIDPGISFGRPVVVRLGISTAVLAERMDAGESIEDLAADYGLSLPEIEQAVLYERTA